MKKPRTITVPIVLDPSFEDAVARAKHELDTAARELLGTFNQRVHVEQTLRPGEDPQNVARDVYDQDQENLATLEAAMKAAQEALTEHCREFTFRSLGFRRWRAMKAEHPSKDKNFAFDIDSIAPALLREASDLSAVEVEEILTSPVWSEGEVTLLVNAAVTVQS